MIRPILFSVAAAMFVLLVFQARAHAGIGMTSDAANQDCANLSGTFRVVTLGQQLECKTPGYTLNFFLNSSGTITTISWHGSRTPPLNSLLGAYADEYEASQTHLAATKASTGGRSPMRANVQSSSHLIVTRKGNAKNHYGSIELK